MKKIAIKSLAAAAFAFCALAGANHVALAQDAGIKVDDAWVRATVPSQHATGVFMRLTSNAAGRLVGVESQAAKHVEIHEMAMQDNVMKMRQVPGIDLPAGQPVELKPGGYHVMLLGLKAPLNVGDKVPVTLKFEQGGKLLEQRVEAEVRGLTAPAHGGGAAANHKH